MRRSIHAVLIADVVGSSARKELRRSLSRTLAKASKRHLRAKLIVLPYAVTAGDEFQTIAAAPEAVPRILLDLRVLFQPLSLRVGVGIGRIADPIRPPVNQLSGPAFEAARTAIERVKRGHAFKFDTLTVFVSSKGEFDESINLLYGLNDTLVRDVTPKQWATISAALKYGSLESSARHLGLDISTISRNLKRGYYWQQTQTVKAAESLLHRAFR